MNRSSLASSLALGLLLLPAAAQSPHDPPPWWGVQDGVTVSLYWNFDTPFPPGSPPLAPNFAVVPSWYNVPTPVTAWTAAPNARYVATLNGHLGVLGMIGNGAPQQAVVSLTVDNDPHLDWVKVFWFQFDAFKGASGDVTAKIAQALGNYDRAIVSETSVPIGQGWQRVTIQAQLIPQPDDEDIVWTLMEAASGTVGIDELFVNSHCIKPMPDQDGDAFGDIKVPPINLTVATGGRRCLAAAATRAPTPTPQQMYWVSALPANAGAPHQIFRLSNTGSLVGAPISVSATSLQAPMGITDLTVETTFNSVGQVMQQVVYGIIDQRSSGLGVQIVQIDAGTGAPNGPPIPLAPFPVIPLQRFGLTFDPTGNLGDGSFWVSESVPTPLGVQMYEFSRDGTMLLDSRPLPAGAVGLAYDDALGNFYCFSSDPLTPQPPSGPVQVHGYELSGYDFLPTGSRFCGNLMLPNPGGPRGGIAAGLDAYRTFGATTSELRLVCVTEVQGPATQFLSELAAPFGYGYSRFGRCRMRNGPPFVGTTFDVALTGVPTSALAMLFLGFNHTAVPVLPEGFASIVPNVSSALLTPTTPGEFVLPISLPNMAGLGYQPVFFQWVVLDSTAPGLIGLTQAGKTVLYP